MKVISLLASSYSGSTVLSMALGSQPQIVAFGDTYFSPAHPLHQCSCGALFRECPFRLEINDELAKKGIDRFWDEAAAIPGGGARLHRAYFYAKRVLPAQYRLLNKLVSRVLLLPSYRSSFNNEQEAFFEALETVSGSSYYFDGCKSIQRARLMQECFPGTKIFHLVRDPRGFVASSAKRLKKRTGKDPDRGFIDERLLQWRRYNVLAARYEREVPPGDYLRVQYADLLSDPEEVLKRTVAFFGLTEQMPDLGKFDLDRLHVSGNRTNLVSSGIEKRVLGDWRKLADVIDFDYVEKQTRDLPFVELEVEDPAQPAAGAKPTPENA